MTYKMRDYPGDQNIAELTLFLDFITGRLPDKKFRRYLEIGSRNGDSFYAVMSAIGAGGFGLSIDLSENDNAKARLLATALELNNAGCRASVIFGNSQDSKCVIFAGQMAPFDLILIDGDHTYEGVSRDWHHYGGMAPVVALHDIAAPDGHDSDGRPNGVRRFWSELCVRYGRNGQAFTIIEPGSSRGFGIVCK